jgi:hypothetical protein
MVGIVVATRAALLIARRVATWTVQELLGGRSPACVALDLQRPAGSSDVLRIHGPAIVSARTHIAGGNKCPNPRQPL